MSKKFKKYSLKVEFLNLEKEEREELFQEYYKKFKIDFAKEIEYMNYMNQKNAKIEEKKPPDTLEAVKPKVSKLSQKIYRNLAKILHPDARGDVNNDEDFKKLLDYYEEDNLIGLISLYNQYKEDEIELSEEEYLFLEEKIKIAEREIKKYETLLPWIWANPKREISEIKNRLYEIMKIDKEKFEEWKNN